MLDHSGHPAAASGPAGRRRRRPASAQVLHARFQAAARLLGCNGVLALPALRVPTHGRACLVKTTVALQGWARFKPGCPSPVRDTGQRQDHAEHLRVEWLTAIEPCRQGCACGADAQRMQNPPLASCTPDRSVSKRARASLSVTSACPFDIEQQATMCRLESAKCLDASCS